VSFVESNDGWVKTVEIATNGTITGVVDSLEYETNDIVFPRLDRVGSSDYYLICGCLSGSDARSYTIYVNPADGQINAAVTDEAVFQRQSINQTMFGLVELGAAGYYAVGYTGVGNDLRVMTFSVNTSDGSIGANIDSLMMMDNAAYDATICRIGQTSMYALPYRGADNDGFVQTVTISSTGGVGVASLDTLEYNDLNAEVPFAMGLGDETIYMFVSYTEVNTDGWITSMSVSVPTGWLHKINTVLNPAKVKTVTSANIKKISTVE